MEWLEHPCVEEMRAVCAPALCPGATVHGLMSGAHVYLRRLLYLPDGYAGTMRECKLGLGTLRMLLSSCYVLQHKRFYPLQVTDLVQSIGTPEQQELMAQLVSCRAKEQLPEEHVLAAVRQHCDQLQQQLLVTPLPQDSLPEERAMNEFYARVVNSLT